jgi:arabinan endo-1,5-alpha-L-arabinosidase
VKLLPVLAVLLASCAGVPPVAEYVNPVLDRDFPDPAVLRDADGWFYAYATQGESEWRMLNIQVARSRDLVQWEHLGDALPRKPPWAGATQAIWAPHVIRDPSLGAYFMYYSAERDDGNGKCLAVAIAQAPAGPFVDAGRPLLCGEGIEHIDPMAFDDPQTGKRLLYWGSGSKPIRVRELAPDRLGFLPGSVPTDVLFSDRDKPYRSLIEGAWATFRNGTYYLFHSGDRCCAREPRYAVMVSRAASALGPFELFSDAARGGSNAILEGGGAWLAPGHNSVATDDEGADWILYHAIHPQRRHAGHPPQGVAPRVMLLDRIVYRDGWPRIEGDRPSSAPRRPPGVRRAHRVDQPLMLPADG